MEAVREKADLIEQIRSVMDLIHSIQNDLMHDA